MMIMMSVVIVDNDGNYDNDAAAVDTRYLETSITGKAVSTIDSMGTGSLEWQFSSDICSDNSQPRALKMTVCQKDEFTCDTVTIIIIIIIHHLPHGNLVHWSGRKTRSRA